MFPGLFLTVLKLCTVPSFRKFFVLFCVTVLRLIPVLVWVAPGVLVIIFFHALRVNRMPPVIPSVHTLTILLTPMLTIYWVAAAFVHLPHLYI
jgi:hypothetical protein